MTASMQSDADLVALAAAGDTDAFSKLHDTYNKFVWYRLWRITASWEQELREDCAQDVWAKLAAGKWRLDRHDGSDGDLLRFVDHLTQLVVWNARRRTRRSREIADEHVAERPIIADVPGALDQLITEQHVDQLRAAVAALPEPDQLLLKMRYWDGLKLRDIAVTLDRSKGVILSQLDRIHRTICKHCDVPYLKTPDRTLRVIEERPHRTAKQRRYQRDYMRARRARSVAA